MVAHKHCPRLVIAATASGSGKTSITLGLCRALARAGLAVQPFKAGPDYLDPTWLSRAAGTQCCNLDTWMSGAPYVRALCARLAPPRGLALIEGVMGMYDGADAGSDAGSTAELARVLGAPVILVADARGAARSVAATVRGFRDFGDADIAGVIANRCGSDTHVQMLQQALASATLPPLVGAIPDGAWGELPSRHLGLLRADERVSERTITALADACEQHVDLQALRHLARQAVPLPAAPRESKRKTRCRIAVAYDAAFHFYYADNLALLARRGAELVYFSPLRDKTLPHGCGAVIIGGGYPEAHAVHLSRNRSLIRDLRAFAARGGVIYGECGGMMYLGEALIDAAGRKHALAGIIPATTRMRPRLQALGYVQATTLQPTLLGPAGTELRGHEFRYSEVVAERGDWEPAFAVCDARGAKETIAGYARGRVLASYLHLHFAAHAETAERIIAAAGEH